MSNMIYKYTNSHVYYIPVPLPLWAHWYSSSSCSLQHDIIVLMDFLLCSWSWQPWPNIHYQYMRHFLEGSLPLLWIWLNHLCQSVWTSSLEPSNFYWKYSLEAAHHLSLEVHYWIWDSIVASINLIGLCCC